MPNEWTITELHPRFIELSRYGHPVLVNADRIVCVYMLENGRACLVMAGKDFDVVVDEPYGKVQQLLEG